MTLRIHFYNLNLLVQWSWQQKMICANHCWYTGSTIQKCKYRKVRVPLARTNILLYQIDDPTMLCVLSRSLCDINMCSKSINIPSFSLFIIIKRSDPVACQMCEADLVTQNYLFISFEFVIPSDTNRFFLGSSNIADLYALLHGGR